MADWKRKRNGSWACKAGAIRYNFATRAYWFYPDSGAPSHGPWQTVEMAMDAVNQVLEPSEVMGAKKAEAAGA